MKPESQEFSMDVVRKWVVTYENQRFYTLINWSPKTLPGERGNWSDINGDKGNWERKNFTLPNKEWKWDGQWTFSMKDTDQYGF